MGEIRLILLLIVAIAIGLLHIAGQYFKWTFFYDPPEDLTFLVSNKIKKIFGPKGVKIYNYTLGGFFVIFGFFSLVLYIIIK